VIQRVIFASEADDDIRAAFQWYGEQAVGLGEEFLRSLRAAVAFIRRHPEAYPTVLVQCRRALMRRFPFEINYDAVNETVFVYAVFHCSRDPERWRSRVRRSKE
jgi:plasmid stabilization system protein ParE